MRVSQFLIGDRIHLINQIGWRQALRWVTSVKELESDSELLLRLREIVHFDIVSEDILTWGIATQVLRAIKVLDELLSNIEINAVYRDASTGSLSIDTSDGRATKIRLNYKWLVCEGHVFATIRVREVIVLSDRSYVHN